MGGNFSATVSGTIPYIRGYRPGNRNRPEGLVREGSGRGALGVRLAARNMLQLFRVRLV